MEHLPNPQLALKGVYYILKDNGITIHVMPNPSWKISMLLLFYPIILIRLPKRIIRKIINIKNRMTGIEKQVKQSAKLVFYGENTKPIKARVSIILLFSKAR